jgi:hypothetical protein
MTKFTYKPGDVTITQTGVPFVSGDTAYRVYVETAGNFGQPGSIQTGLSVTNLNPMPTMVTAELYNSSGAATGLKTEFQISGYGQKTWFIGEASGFESLPDAYQAVMRVSTDGPSEIAVTGLRGRYNERREFLITSTPAVPEGMPVSNLDRFVAHIASGGGYKSQVISFSGALNQNGTGKLKFFTPLGLTPNLVFE